MTRKMKDSGIEWIREIPEDWKVKRLKSLLVERKESNNPIKTDFILSLTNNRGVIPYSDKGEVGNRSKEDITGYKLAYPNDIVLNSMNVIIGSVGLSQYFGAVSPVYYMLYKRNNDDFIEFYNYIFQTEEFQNSLKGYGNGILEIRMRIQMSKLNTVMLPYVESSTQCKIVSYLNRKCEKLDKTIENNKQMIERLKYYKQSIIAEIVIQGLNPNVPMRETGIEWIGDVPSNWEFSRIKNVIENVKSGISAITSNDSSVESNSSVLRTSSVSSGIFKPNECKTVLESEKNRLICPVEKDTLIVSRMNVASMVGSSGYVDKDYENLYLPDKLWKVKFISSMNAKYVWYLLNCHRIRAWFSSIATGASSSMLNISLNDFENTRVPIPPVIEQYTIVEYLDKKCNSIDKAISNKEKLIEKLTEYKKSLIYECVTGKREV